MPRENKAAGWILANVRHKGDDCLIWPFSRDPNVGRGRLGVAGNIWWAHRFMCLLAHGEPPTSDHEASHSCGNGKGGCVNPRHLSWKTASENHLDRRLHGTQATNRWGRKGKLTPIQVEEILVLKGRKTQVEIGKMFGVPFQTIGRLHRDGGQKSSAQNSHQQTQEKSE